MTKCSQCSGDITFSGREWHHVPPFAGGSGALKDTKTGKKCRRPMP